MRQSTKTSFRKAGALGAGGFASVAALAGWSLLMAATGPRSAVRYVLYWATVAFVPVALVGAPYAFTRRAWPRRGALIAAACCGLVITALFIAWVALALAVTRTFTF